MELEVFLFFLSLSARRFVPQLSCTWSSRETGKRNSPPTILSLLCLLKRVATVTVCRTTFCDFLPLLLSCVTPTLSQVTTGESQFVFWGLLIPMKRFLSRSLRRTKYSKRAQNRAASRCRRRCIGPQTRSASCCRCSSSTRTTPNTQSSPFFLRGRQHNPFCGGAITPLYSVQSAAHQKRQRGLACTRKE